MKTAILSSALLLVSTATWAAEVPRCWESEDPTIDDRVFLVTMATEGLSAQDVAAVLFELTGVAATQTAVGSNRYLDKIVFELKSPDLSHWRPSVGLPTLEAAKQWTLKGLAPILAMKGIEAISCHKKWHAHPMPQ